MFHVLQAGLAVPEAGVARKVFVKGEGVQQEVTEPFGENVLPRIVEMVSCSLHGEQEAFWVLALLHFGVGQFLAWFVTSGVAKGVVVLVLGCLPTRLSASPSPSSSFLP